MAAAPLTKTVPRQYIALFLDPPFMKFGLSILMKKGDKSSKIESMVDLGRQEDIKYGLVGGGTTWHFFDRGVTDDYNKMGIKMKNDTDISFLASVEAGVKRVRESSDSEPFAFIGEQYTIEYHASREPCDLVAVPGLVEEYTGEYHLAVAKGLEHDDATDRIKEALLHLNGTGRLNELYNKWWKERDQCSDGDAAKPVTVDEPCSAVVTSATFAMFALVPVVVAVLFRVSGE